LLVQLRHNLRTVFGTVIALGLGLSAANWNVVFAAPSEEPANSQSASPSDSSSASSGAKSTANCLPSKSKLVQWAEEASWDAKSAANRVGLRLSQEKIIQQITTIFENGTKDFQYASISQLNDGKGLNVGRVGFNTKAGTLQILVKQYLAASASKPTPARAELEKYLPCLSKIQGTGEYDCLYPNTKKLDKQSLLNSDFGKAWKDASNQPLMKDLQDKFVKDSYLEPALKLANQANLNSALGRAFIYDTVVQSGEGGADKLVRETTRKYESTHPGFSGPTKPEEETEWLKLFNKARSFLLSKGPVDTATRVNALSKILDAQNFDLRPPVKVQYHGDYELNSGG